MIWSCCGLCTYCIGLREIDVIRKHKHKDRVNEIFPCSLFAASCIPRLFEYLCSINALGGALEKVEGVFEEIKDRLSMPEVVKFYGFNPNFAGMMCCPFHEDRNPSMKVYEKNYHCFGCGESGDATSFVAKLYGLRQIDAAKKMKHISPPLRHWSI